ncbi:MAG: methyltransferase [Byssovorax sp.]
MATYLLDQSWKQESERLQQLEQWTDPVTISHLAQIGVGPGWKCLEVGAGGGSIARHLATTVGATGRVLAIDLNTALFDADASAVLEVRRLDFMTEELPTGFDFVHARLVVGHQADRVDALRRLSLALRPGGVLLVEENDIVWSELRVWPVHNDPVMAELVGRVWKALIQIMKQGGYDGHCGRSLPAEMLAAGLTEVQGEARSRINYSGGGISGLTSARFRDPLVAAGAVTSEEMDHYLERCFSGEILMSSPLQVSVRGTRAMPPT